MPKPNETHEPALTSWVESANRQGTDFPIQNLPFSVRRRRGSAETGRGGVAIGDQVLGLAAMARLGVFGGLAGDALNPLMALPRALRVGSPDAQRLATCLVPEGP